MHLPLAKSGLAFVALGIIILALACQSQSAATPAVETLKIGIMTPLTGAGTRLGTNIDRLIRIGLDDINKKGGIKAGGKAYQVDAISVDSKFNSEGGRAAADRLVLNEKVRFALGSLQQDTAGASAVTAPNKVMIFAASIIDQSLGPNFPLNFLAGFPHMRMRSAVLYQLLRSEYPQAKRVGTMSMDDVAGRSYVELAEIAAKAQGFEIASKEFVPIDIKDFAPLVTRLNSQNLDALDINVGGEGSIFLRFTKALYDQGWRKPLFGPSSDLASMRQGAAYMQGFTTTVLADPKADVVTKGDKDVAERFVKQHGEADFEPMALATYNVPIILAQAMEKAGTVDDTTKIADTMRSGEWDASFGRTRFVGAKTFGLASVLEQPIYLTRVQGDKVVTFRVIQGTLP